VSAFADRDKESSMPGFVLTESWYTEAGVPHKGILSLRFTSKSKRGKRRKYIRSTNPNLRKALLSMVSSALTRIHTCNI